MLIAGMCHFCANHMNEIVVINVKRASVASENNCFVLCALGCIGMCVCVFVIRQLHLCSYSGNYINKIARIYLLF
jgi:hypothetical protein